MSYLQWATMIAVLLGTSSLTFGAKLLPIDVTVGQNLETPVKVKLDMPAKQQLEITVTSDNPSLMLLSTSPELAGAASIIVRVGAGSLESPDFYIQGLAKSGTTTYKATASGFDNGIGTVTLGPSGFVVTAASSTHSGEAKFSGVIGAETRLTIRSVLLDSSLNFLAQQAVAGGVSASIEVTTLDPQVGTIVNSPIIITGGRVSALTKFRSKALGSTTVIVNAPHGFSTPAQFGKLLADVTLPGIDLRDHVSVGKDLETCERVALASEAPPDGAALTLTSDSPQLLLSTTGHDRGSQSITIQVHPGSKTAYCMQALADSGVATVTAAAPGYRSRTSQVTLTPSGVLMGYGGPPDEAELFRKESAEREHGIVTSLSSGPVNFGLYTARLDPVTHRGADITVQTLRPGASAKVEVKSSNPAVGKVTSTAVITDSECHVQFTPLSVGKTVVSFTAPEGFTTPGNVTAFTVIVK